MSKKLGYRANIDVLRAFAVLPVVLFHLNVGLIPGGFLGVDVFFVISGYLITKLLKAELEQGGINLLEFWRRRILRILPALITMVLITFLAGQLLLFAPERDDLAVNSWAALLSVSNISHWLNYGGYWGAEAGNSPLLHTWSLGVEEQFYLLYPIFLLLLFRCFNRIPVWLIISVLLVSFGIFIYGLQNHPSSTFYLLPARAWELAAGATAALISSTSLKIKVANTFSFIGLVLVLAAYIFAKPNSLSVWNVVAVTGAALVVYSSTQTFFKRVRLNNSILLYVGLISYSLYLYHYPVVVYGKSIEAKYNIEIPLIVEIFLMFLLAWLSYQFVEVPLRYAKSVALKVGIVNLFLAGLAFWASSINYQEDVSNFEPTEWAGNIYRVNPGGAQSKDLEERMKGINVLDKELHARNLHSDIHKEGIKFAYSDGRQLDVLVLGDSHGLQWSTVINEIMREMGKNVLFMTADGTPVFFDIPIKENRQKSFMFTSKQLEEFKQARLKVIREKHPKLVVISSYWREEYINESEDLINEISKTGAKVLLIADPPRFDIGDRNAPQYLSYLGVQESEDEDVWLEYIDYGRYKADVKVVKDIAARCNFYCVFVEPGPIYMKPANQNNGVWLLKVIDDGKVLYIDDDHLSVAGAKLSKQLIHDAIEEIFSGSMTEVTKTGDHY